jgi:hypothetical protein
MQVLFRFPTSAVKRVRPGNRYDTNQEDKASHKMTTDFDLSEFLLPSNHNDPADLRHGIPQVLKFGPGPITTSTSTVPLHHATQPHRLPYRVIHDPNLPSRMVKALRSILNESTPLDLRPLTVTWHAHRITERPSKTNGAEAGITQTSFDLLKVVCHSVSSLKSPRRAEQQPQHTTDGQVTVDHILHWDGLKEPVVLIEEKSTSVMEAHLPRLLAVTPDIFRRTGQSNWEGALSIIAKVKSLIIIQLARAILIQIHAAQLESH